LLEPVIRHWCVVTFLGGSLRFLWEQLGFSGFFRVRVLTLISALKTALQASDASLLSQHQAETLEKRTPISSEGFDFSKVTRNLLIGSLEMEVLTRGYCMHYSGRYRAEPSSLLRRTECCHRVAKKNRSSIAIRYFLN